MKQASNITIGITGATGFVGSYIIRELLQHGHQRIVALKRPNSSMRLAQDFQHKVSWKEGDLLDLPSLEDAFSEVDVMVHAAALVSFNQSDKSKLKKINIEGTRNIVNLAIDFKYKKFVHLSSVAAIGRNKSNRLVDEDSQWEEDMLNTPYAISKRHAELEVWRGFAEGLPALILNPTIILGAAHWNKGSSAIIPRIIKGVPFYPKGASGFVDVRDVAKAARLAITSPQEGERYIINSANLSYENLFEKVCEIAARKAPAKSIPSWSHGLLGAAAKLSAWMSGRKPIITTSSLRMSAQHFSYDNNKSVNQLGMSYRPIEETIRQTTEQYLLAKEGDEAPGILSLAN